MTTKAIEGKAGHDVLNGREGFDTLVGGAGNDIYIIDRTVDLGTYDDVKEVVGVTDAGGLDSVYFTANANGQFYDLLMGSKVEYLYVFGNAAFAVSGAGNELNNVFVGHAGFNDFTGKDGNDTYYLQTSNDIARETNSLTAGGTADLVIFSGTAAAQTYTLSDLFFVENLTMGGALAINGTGNVRANTITGNGVANTLKGNGGNDILKGMAGVDTLIGGVGRDTLVGGAQGDKFKFVAVTDSGITPRPATTSRTSPRPASTVPTRSICR